MDELLRLLGEYEQGITDLDDAALQQLLDDIRAESEALLEGDPTDEQLDLLGRVVEAVQAIEAEQSTRAEAQQDRADRARTLRDQILGQTEEEGEAEGEAEEGGEAEGEPGEAEGEGEEGGAEAETPQPVAAAARPARRAGMQVTRVAARRPAAQNPRPRSAQPERQPVTLVAAANLPDVQAGQVLDSPLAVARAFVSGFKSAAGYRGPRVKVPIARIGGPDARDLYGPERYLNRDAQRNHEIIESVVSREAIVAAGGVCVTPNVNYDMPTVGTDARPVRDDMMARFGADRGGVTTLPPPTLADVAGSVDVWTEANDQNPTDPTTKPCLTLTCPDEDTTMVEAVTRCLEIGNFRARFFPEQVQSWLDLSAVLHARTADTQLLTAIGSGSTQVTSGELLGAAIDVLTTLDRAVSAIRSRHRLGDNEMPLRFGAPRWLRDMMRADIARQIPGTGTFDEKLALADAQIQRWIEARNVNVTWFLDGESGQVFGPQGDGPLIGWPTTVVTYLYPEGSWLFLDGGELDLGIIRDTVSSSTNDYQIFYESFEGAHYHGVESYRLAMDLCPSGGVAGTVDIDPCSTGS